jgi:hypothetical protein
MGVSVGVVTDGQNDDQRTPRHHRDGDSGSVPSSSRSDQMIIKKNVQYIVQYEEAAQQRRKTDPCPEGKSAQMRNDKNDGEPSWAIQPCWLERKVASRMPCKMRPGHCLKSKKCVSRAHEQGAYPIVAVYTIQLSEMVFRPKSHTRPPMKGANAY